MTNPLTPLYDAVAWVIMRLHAGLGAIFGDSSGAAWALSIVILVVLMRLLLVPLFIKQMHATRKMTALAPQVAELKKKYKGDKQKLNEETMKLYKDNGANPLAGCLPVVAQLPVFFALFGVLRAIAEDQPKYGLTPAVVASAQHAKIFGVVTVADRLLTSILPPTFSSIGTRPADRHPADRRGQRHDHVHDRPAEHEARHDPAGGPEQPDGVVAEDDAVHRAGLRPVRAVLAVRPGPVLGHHQPVDAGPAVRAVQEVPAAGRWRPRARAGTPATTGGKSAARPAGKGAPAKPAGNVTAAGRAAARQQAAAKAAAAQPAKADGAQPAAGNGAQPAAAQSSRPPINQLRKSPAKSAPAKPAQGKQAGNGAAKAASAAGGAPREPDPARTAAAAACAGSSRAAPNLRHPRPSPSPRLRSSGSSRCGSPAAGARASDKAKARHDPCELSCQHVSTRNEEEPRW